jgi:hypothetical protein
MLKSNFFKPGDLVKKDLQYLISFDSTLNFQINDIVFLKSNPEITLKVINNDLDKVYCLDEDNNIYDFYPQMILHYKWASILTYKKKWDIYLN